MVRTSSDACPSCRPISVMPTSRILTGISPALQNYSEQRESEWKKGGEVFYEKPRRFPHFVGVILYTTSDRPTKCEPAHHRFLSGYLSLAAAFRSRTTAQATVATGDRRHECPIPGNVPGSRGEQARQ